MGTQTDFLLQCQVPVIILSMILTSMAFPLPTDSHESTSGHTQQVGLRLKVTLEFSVLVPVWKLLNLKHLWENTIFAMKELRTLPPLHATTWTLPSGTARAVYGPAAAVPQVACLGSAAPSHDPPQTTLKCGGAPTRIWATRLLRPNCWRSLSSNLCALRCTLPVANTLVHSLGTLYCRLAGCTVQLQLQHIVSTVRSHISILRYQVRFLRYYTF